MTAPTIAMTFPDTIPGATPTKDKDNRAQESVSGYEI